jgi:hypothetical protein
MRRTRVTKRVQAAKDQSQQQRMQGGREAQTATPVLTTTLEKAKEEEGCWVCVGAKKRV